MRQPQVEVVNVEPNIENENRQPPLRYGNVHILQGENNEQVNPRALDALRQNVMHNNVNVAVEEALTRYGLNIGHAVQPYFVSAFPDWVQQAEMPRGMKVPKLTKFSGDSGESTVEHIARYTIELGELSLEESLRMRLFPSSLTKNAFSWFSTLRPNSIHSWYQLERSFHDQFFRGEFRVGLTDLLNIKRLTGESIDDYLARFRQMRSRCFTPIPEPEIIKMAIMGLDYYVRKKLVNQHLMDLAHLSDKVRQIEQLKMEKWNNKKKFLKREKVNVVGYESEDQDSDVEYEVDVIEWKSGPPYVCHALKPSKGKTLMPYINKKSYTFDVSKVDQIFDILLKDKQIRLSDDHKLLKSHEIGDRKYCKFHNSFGHVLNDCYHFRDMIQKGINEGRLKFADKPTMKVDTEPFGPDQEGNSKKPALFVGMVNVKGKELYDSNKVENTDIFPKKEESVTEFFNRRADKGIIKICPKCETFFDNTAAEKVKQQVMFDKRQKKNYWYSGRTWTGESSQSTVNRPSVWSRMKVPPANVQPNTWYRNTKGNQQLMTQKYQWKEKESVKERIQAVKKNTASQSVQKTDGFVSSKTEKRRRQRMRQAEKKRLAKQLQKQTVGAVQNNPNIKKVEQKSPPSKSTGKWPVCLVEMEQMAEVEQKFSGKVQINLQKGIDIEDDKARKSFERLVEDLNNPSKQILEDDEDDYEEEDLEEMYNAYQEENGRIDDNLNSDAEDLRSDLVIQGSYVDEEIEAVKMNIDTVSILPSSYEGSFEVYEEEHEEVDEAWIFIQNNLITVFDNVAQLEKPTEEERKHLRPLHVRALIDGNPTNRVLVDGGAAVNLMPRALFKKLGKNDADLISTDMVVTDFSGKSSPSDGVVLMNIQVGSVERMTLFVVIPTKSSYNILLGRDWIHAVGAIPSTVHQKLILWNDKDQVEIVEADDSPCYVQQSHVDFKMYSPQVRPIEVFEGIIDKETLEVCLFNQFGVKIIEKADETRRLEEC